MKKVFALLAVSAFAFAFVACGGKKTDETPTEDTTKVVTPVPADTIPADTASVDSTTVK